MLASGINKLIKKQIAGFLRRYFFSMCTAEASEVLKPVKLQWVTDMKSTAALDSSITPIKGLHKK